MGVQNLWPLWFLALIPAVVILYILKQKAVDQQFSSTMLWKEIFKNLEARTPFEKFRQNILLYLQILLLLLLILALMAPVLHRGRAAGSNVVIVMDISASMDFAYSEGRSRLEEGIARAEDFLDSLEEGTKITLISGGSESTLLYQGTDSYTAKKRLKSLAVSSQGGTLDGAALLVNSLTRDLENVQIYCYTDTAFASGDFTKSNRDAALFVEDLYSVGENCFVEYVNYGQKEDVTEVLCRVKNGGEETVSQDVSLYLEGRLLDVASITLAPGESQVVYFAPQQLGEQAKGVLTAELSKKDSLAGDNRQSVQLSQRQEKRVLLLSEGNVFLEKALGLIENVTVMKSDDIRVLNQENDGFDLYVFDGISLPENMDIDSLSQDAGVLFVNLDSVGDGSYLKALETVKECYLYFGETPVTEYVKDFSIGVTECRVYELPSWGQPFLKTGDGRVTGYWGNGQGHSIGVLGFDLHSTDFALKAEFPIFMSQLEEALLQTTALEEDLVNFPVATESEVLPVTQVSEQGNQTAINSQSRSLRNLVLLAALVFLALEWICYVRQTNSRKKRQYLVVRIAVVLCLVLAMAGITMPRQQGKSQTIFLVDASDSMAVHMEDIEAYIEAAIAEMPDKNEAAVVVFGKNTVVEQFLSKEKIFSRFSSMPVSSATNIENAIVNANAMFDEGVDKNLILITDGSENDGNMTLAAGGIAGSDVSFRAVAMTDGIAANREVYVENVSVPSVIHVGDHYNVTVSIQSNVETDAKLSLYSGRNLKGQQEIHVTKGVNRFIFEDTGTEGNIAQYKAVLEPYEDTISANNTFVTFAEIEAVPRVLLVEGKTNEGAEFEKVLAAANVACDRVSPKGVPVSISELSQYKAVVTLNVYYDDLRQGFPETLKTYVKDYAGGYICIGGDNSYALGAYRNTPLEEILPVHMEMKGEKEIPKMAMAMVIDQSGSMSSPTVDNSSVTGLDLAKQAALSGVSELRSSDEVGVLAFDDTYHWIVPMQAAEDIEAIKEDITSIGYGGGTSIYPALEQAYEQVAKSDAKIKHIILLTDGQDGYTQYEELLQKMKAGGITVSTVAVGADSAQDILSYIAEECGGRAYYTDINNSIPRIFAQEVYLSTNTYLINEKFYPTVSSNHEILTGVKEDFPPLLGYVGTTEKSAADVILRSDRRDPVLAAWQYGLGKTVAWCSDGDNQWTRAFATWENTPLFWANAVHFVISDTGLGEDTLEVEKSGNSVTIRYGTGEYTQETVVEAVITSDGGNSQNVNLSPVRPGVFEGELSADEVGVYSISVRKTEEGQVVKSYNTAYASQYSKEYQFNNGSTDFASFVAQAGGTLITMEDEVWITKPKNGQSRVSLTIPFLIAALLLWMVDILIRRLSLDVAGFFSKIFAAIKRIDTKRRKKEKEGRRDIEQKTVEDETQRNIVPKGAEVNRKDPEAAEAAKKSKVVHNEEDAKNIKKTKKAKKAKNSQKSSGNEALDMEALLRKKRERE